MERLTADQVRNTEPPAKGQTLIWDSEVAGFGLRVTAGGAKSFILNYRFADPTDRRKTNQYRYTIGPAKTAPRGAGWGVDEARKVADEWAKKIDRGESHPLADRRGRHDAAKAAREAETFKAALTEYIQHEQRGRKQNVTADEADRALRRGCAAWLDRPLADITANEIGTLLRQVRDGDGKDVPARPYMANRLHSYLKTFMSWCAQPDVQKITTSPMIGMKRPWEGESVRDRVYTDEELKRIWSAADAIGSTAGAFIKLALLTGKRRGALVAMRWDEIDNNGIWTPPVDLRRRKRTKRVHAIPLPGLVLRVIKPLRPKPDDQAASPYVFPGRHHGTLLAAGTDLANAVKAKSKVKDFFIHALRHTVETRLAALKVPPHIRDLVLDHAPFRGAGGGYDHHAYADEIAEALELWSKHIEVLVSPAGATLMR